MLGCGSAPEVSTQLWGGGGGLAPGPGRRLSQRRSLSQVLRKEELAGGKVMLNIPTYAGFHTRACARPVLWWRLKPVIKAPGLL